MSTLVYENKDKNWKTLLLFPFSFSLSTILAILQIFLHLNIIIYKSATFKIAICLLNIQKITNIFNGLLGRVFHSVEDAIEAIGFGRFNLRIAILLDITNV